MGPIPFAKEGDATGSWAKKEKGLEKQFSTGKGKSDDFFMGGEERVAAATVKRRPGDESLSSAKRHVSGKRKKKGRGP